MEKQRLIEKNKKMKKYIYDQFEIAISAPSHIIDVRNGITIIYDPKVKKIVDDYFNSAAHSSDISR